MIFEHLDTYFDDNASRPVNPLVYQKLLDKFYLLNANPSAVHKVGLKARQELIEATRNMENLLQIERDHLIFTSGATESINTVIRGLFAHHQGRKNVLITTLDQHSAVLNTAKALEVYGLKIIYLPLDHKGCMAISSLESLKEHKCFLISLMSTNNETGIIGNYQEVFEASKKIWPEIKTHLDATQSVGRSPHFEINKQGADYVSFSGHKFGALKGVGGLYFAPSELKLFEPLITGGSQQRSKRGGTENLLGIVSMSLALEETLSSLKEVYENTSVLKQNLEQKILAEIPDSFVVGHQASRNANTLNVGFKHVQADSLLLGLDLENISVSYGSACTSGSLKPSASLLALGYSEEQAKSCIRISIGPHHTVSTVNFLFEHLKSKVAHQRKFLSTQYLKSSFHDKLNNDPAYAKVKNWKKSESNL